MGKLNPDHRNRARRDPDQVSLFFERMEPKILFSADALSGLMPADPFDDSNAAASGLDISESADNLNEAYAPAVNDSDHQESGLDAEPLEIDALQALLEGPDSASDDIGTDDSLETFLEGSITSAHERQELIFVDAATPDYEQLLGAVNTDTADTDYQIFVLQSEIRDIFFCAFQMAVIAVDVVDRMACLARENFGAMRIVILIARSNA